MRLKEKMTDIKIAYLLLAALILFSCNRAVYFQTDSLGTSKYIIYKDNYKYVEKTIFSNFKIWGEYEVTDSSIVFEYKDRNRIPYNYFEDNVEMLDSIPNSEFIKIKIVDRRTNEPLAFVSIGAKNKSNEYIDGAQTDFGGKAKLRNKEEIQLIEIKYIGYPYLMVNYQEKKSNSLLIKMEELKAGGRMEGCLIHYLDVLLEYRIDNPSNIKRLERNRTIFELQSNTR